MIMLLKLLKQPYFKVSMRQLMGVATFDASSEMPEELRKALPDVDDLKKLL